MSGPAGADLLIGRVRRGAAGIADGRGHDAGELPERLLVAPEAAEPEDRGLRAVRPRPGEGRAEDRVDPWLDDRVGPTREGLAGEGMDGCPKSKKLMPKLYSRPMTPVTSGPGREGPGPRCAVDMSGYGARRCQSGTAGASQASSSTDLPLDRAGSAGGLSLSWGPSELGRIGRPANAAALEHRARFDHPGPVGVHDGDVATSVTCQKAIHRPSGRRHR